MRIALLADIHSNAIALRAVIDELENERPDSIVCLGDVAATGPQPKEALLLVRELNCPVVLGNADEWLFKPASAHTDDEAANKIVDIDFWCAGQLSESDLNFIRTFQPSVEMRFDEGVRLFCSHGSPRSNTEPILATTSDGDLEEMLQGVDCSFVAVGHTHLQMLRRFGSSSLINPGSVGLPFESVVSTGQVLNPPWAEYGLLTAEGAAARLEFRRVPFDVQTLVQVAKASGMPHADWWCEDWMRKQA